MICVVLTCVTQDKPSVNITRQTASTTASLYLCRIGTQIWNSIPYSIKLLKRSSFRKKIKELLLNFLRSEDDYVEVSDLIKLFNTLG